jgi:methylated-DNA-[protein]-cysteine S-methyltransferase
MAERGFALFETAIGPCGIAWRGDAVAGVQLPEGGLRGTRTRLARRFPDAREAPPPPAVRRAIAGMTALLGGTPTDLSFVELDMAAVPPFHRRVYEAARAIAAGRTLSYGEVARRIDAPGSARAVGQALGRNPFPIVVPCHRVLAAGGRTGGFTADGGVGTKLRMLAIEGAPVNGALPFAAPGLGFDPATGARHLRGVDPALARVIDAVGPCRLAAELKTTSSVFGALAEAIVYQQLTGKAAATIYGRVCALFPRRAGGPKPADLLGASDERLRGAGLSRAKTAALRDLAEKAVAGAIPTLAEARAMDDAAVIERLTAVRGVGRWTAEMLLIFRLGRPDVLPLDDHGVRKGFAAALRRRGLPSRRDLERRGERWRPYRTVASWYLWRAAERTKR